MREAIEFNFPNFQYILDALRESGDFRRRGKLFAPRSTFRATPKRNVEHRQFHLAQSLLLVATHSNVPTLRLLHSREGAGVLNVRFFPDARSLRMSLSTRSNPHKDVSSMPYWLFLTDASSTWAAS